LKLVTIDAFGKNPKDYVCIGRQGENNATAVVFDCSAFAEIYGEGAAELLCKRPGDTTPYPCAAKQSGNLLSWAITETDTAKRGVGQIELRWYVKDTLAKSVLFHTTILGALSTSVEDESDEPHKAWMDAVLSAGVEAKANAAESKQNAELAAQSEELVTNAATAAAESEANAAQSAETAQASTAEAATSASSAKAAAESAAQSEKNASASADEAKAAAETAMQMATEALNQVQLSAIQHRNVYRGKNLGTSVTDAQKAAIQNATFDDLYVGDYWTINGTKYVIADMNYWYNTGDTAFARNHLVLMPDMPLYNAQMNTTATTTGGYVGSKMYTENLETAKTTISSAFGDLLLTHREYLVNAVTDGSPSAGAWYDSTVEIPNEIMVYGLCIYTPAGNGTAVYTRYTIDKQQLSLFRLNPSATNNRQTFWLRDVVSSSLFAGVNGNGAANSPAASDTRGVRPVFAIG
jgi:hypothetical protein